MHCFRVNFAVANIFKRILESQNLAKNEKRFAKMRRRKYARPAFTMLALTMIAGAVHFQNPGQAPKRLRTPGGGRIVSTPISGRPNTAQPEIGCSPKPLRDI